MTWLAEFPLTWVIGGKRVQGRLAIGMPELVEVDVRRMRAQPLEQRVPDGGLAPPGRPAQPPVIDIGHGDERGQQGV